MPERAKIKEVFIIHGYDSSPRKNWFLWLESELKKYGDIKVAILDLPDSQNPNLNLWIQILRQAISPSKQTFLVGHSLGCITILQYLQTLDCVEIGGVVLASGFAKALPSLPLLDSFTHTPLDYSKLKAMIHKRVVLSAKDDSIVPTTLSKELAQNLGADFIQTQEGGHFMDSDGFRTFPLALEKLAKMMG